MKKLLLPLVLLIGAAAVVTHQWQESSETPIQEQQAAQLAEGIADAPYHDQFGQPIRGIARAFRYLHQLRANQETNTLDFTDVYKARKMVHERMLQKDENEIVWEPMGPNNVGGRTRAILLDKDNPQKMIIGGVSGGIFTSNDGGLNWIDHPQNETLSSINICAIAQASNGDIYIGTGEGASLDFAGGIGTFGSGAPGIGMFKSTDGGTTFEHLPSTEPTGNPQNDPWGGFYALEAHPDNANWIYAATIGGAQMSTDGGETWFSPSGLPSVSTTPAYDIEAASDGTIHVTIGSNYYKSTDGMNFEQKSGSNIGQFPFGSGRKELAVSPSDPNFVYCAIVFNSGVNFSCLDKVIQSQDAGETWVEIGEGGSSFFQPMSNGAQCQGGYDLTLAVDPSNPNRIILGGITLWSWSNVDDWLPIDNLFENPSNLNYVHADKHALVFHPTNPDILYVGSDGGIARSLNATSIAPTFQPLNKNYNVTQFYSVAAGVDGRVAGGTQDNGTQYVTFNENSALTSLEVRGGDGGFTEISEIFPNIVFAATPDGDLARSSNEGESFTSYLDENIDCEPFVPDSNPPSCNGDDMIDGGALFVTPYVLWEDFNTYFFDGTTVNAKMVTGGADGRVWITNNPLDASVVPTWRSIGQASGGGTGRTITAVAISAQGDMVFAGTMDGRLIRIRNIDDDSPTVQEIDLSDNEVTPDVSIGNRHVTAVAIDNLIPSNVVVTLGNYGNSDYVLRSINGTSTAITFESMQGEGSNALPPMPVYDITIDVFNSNRIYAATDMGVWMCEIEGFFAPFSYDWTSQNEGVGNVQVHRIRQEVMGFPGCYVLYIGTHGRGFFRSTTFTFPGCETTLPEWEDGFEPTGIETSNAFNAAIKLYPNPMASQSTLEINVDETLEASLFIFDLQGKRVRAEKIGTLTNGTNTITVERKDLAAGNYIMVVNTEKR